VRLERPVARGVAAAPAPSPSGGVRIVLDTRPLQDPDRSPTTAAYLEGLVGAFDAAPLDGESFTFLLQADLADPTERFRRLDVRGRRLLPPTRLLGAAALTLDPFLVRGASIGTAWRAERRGAGGAVYHTAGGAVPVPVLSDVATVVTLLDLAPWELPEIFQRGTAARFGQRLRAGLIRQAAAVIVATEEVARDARRLLHLRRSRIRVVALAPRAAFRPEAATAGGDAERTRLGLPGRYLVYAGRFDARHDLGTLLSSLAILAAAGRPASLAPDLPWPPRVLLVGASPDDRASLARAAAREGVRETLTYAPHLPPERLAGLVAGARAALLPVVSEAAGLSALEALAAGTPVVASAVGALPGVVGTAGILVEPGEPERLARALATIWSDDRVHERLRLEAQERALRDRRTWDDVAADTRAIYADVGQRGSRPRHRP